MTVKHKQSSNYYFGQLIRSLADTLDESYNVTQKIVKVNRFTLKELLGHIAVKKNLTILEMEYDLGISKRTISKLTSYNEDMYISMRSQTIKKIVEYAYNIAEIYEKK